LTPEDLSILATHRGLLHASQRPVRATLEGGLKHLAEWKSKENSLKEFLHCQVVYILTKEWPELNIELRQIMKLKYQKEQSRIE
jgi:hypothetical protein